MEDLHVPSAPKYITCEEDDDFVAMFDKMLNDNITESRLAAVPKAQQVGLTVPTHFKQTKKTYGKLELNNSYSRRLGNSDKIIATLLNNHTSFVVIPRPDKSTRA